MKIRSMLALALTVTAAGCGGDREPGADTTGIALSPRDTTQYASPQELPPSAQPPAAQPTPPPPSPRPAPPPAAQPAPPPAAPPAAPATRTAPAGAEIVSTTTAEISTRRNKAGETFTANISEAVTDASGRTVIPAGATMTFRIVESKEAESKDKPGTLAILPVSMSTGGKSYDINGEITDLQYELKGRGVTAGDAGKVAAGAAVGAIVGQILTKKTAGTVVGGAIGAAAGTAIAIKSADRDIVIPSGGRIVVKLKDPVTVTTS
ncbi:MAG TPA: hypothetical protein VFO95_18685 [Gemmatimonadales bacterium]|nr:hypothetical protein [Gemmatimonadales bacterium]